MHFNETLHSDSPRDPQHVCSLSGHQVKGQKFKVTSKNHFNKKLEYDKELPTALTDFNKTLHSDSPRGPQHVV